MGYVLGTAKSSAAPWLTLYPVTQFFGTNGETGIDLGTPFGTPITALVTGKVLGDGYYGGGGVVSQEMNLNGQPASLYYQHLDRIAPGIVAGVMVQAGQLIGYSGGQLSGGSHPSSSQFSTGPHTEVGVNAPYGGMWNPYNYGPNINPLLFLPQLLAGLPANAAGVSGAAQVVSGNVGATTIRVTTAPGFGPIAQSLHDSQAFVPLSVNPLQGLSVNPGDALIHDAGAVVSRGIVVAVGFLIVGAVVVSAATQFAQQQGALAGQVIGAASQAGMFA
jgi:hypothetical protein